MKYLLKLSYMLFIAMLIISCDDEFSHDLVRDNLPEIPVTFDGATTAGFNPYYTVSYGTGSTAFDIKFSIPGDAPSKIKEVTKISAGTTAINAGTLNGTSGKYITDPIAVNGTSFTLSSSITEFNTKVTGSTRLTAAPVAPVEFVERAFMFELLMEDGSKIVPVQVRIRVTP